MVAKRKAFELVKKYYDSRKRPLISFWKDIRYAKKCALIAVDEILHTLPDTIQGYFDDGPQGIITVDNPHKDFWKDVRQEIVTLNQLNHE